jgi:FkbM family methyltransferase
MTDKPNAKSYGRPYMGVVRSRVAKIVKWVLARQGFVLFRATSKFGLDPWADINHLSDDWNYPITLFFDVGANDGETAVTALRQFPKARVISFEPHPVTFSELMTRMGDEARFQGVNSALGSEIGEVEMFEYGGSSKINSLTDDAQYAVRYGMKGKGLRIGVQCTTLDAYCAQNKIERIDVLKIDTEGFDFTVLQGSIVMLQKHAIKFIYFEFNDLQPKEGTFGGALMPIDALLRPHGYRFVASYNDLIATDGEMFSVSNALFALPPLAVNERKPSRRLLLND